MKLDRQIKNSIVEAHQHVNNKKFKDYKFELSDFDFEELRGMYSNKHGNNPKNDRQQNYVNLRNTLIEEFAGPIAEGLINNSYETLRQFTDQMDEATDKVMYRMMAVLNKPITDTNSSWLSSSIIESDVQDFIRDKIQHDNNEYFREVFGSSIFTRQESQLATEILNVDDHRISHSMTQYTGEKFSLKKEYAAFASTGTFYELASVLMHEINSFDGRLPEQDVERATNAMLAMGLNRIYDRSDITIHQVNVMVKSGEISPVKLWDTKYFKDNLAPIVNDEIVEMGKEYMEKFVPKDSLVYKLKDDLSRNEIFNYFINSELSSENKWQGAMAQFAHFTGERLTFDEARELNPTHNFVLTSTKAYSDILDKENNPDDYINIDIDIEVKDVINNDWHEGEKEIQIEVSCKTTRISEIEEIMSNLTLEIEELSGCDGIIDGIRFEGYTDSNNPKIRANEIALILKEKLQEIQAVTILPGDVVQIVESENCLPEDYGLKVGKKHLVTDVNRDGDFKVKGSKEYAPCEIGEIRKKHVLKISLDQEMNI
jgi:hypothetical protein